MRAKVMFLEVIMKPLLAFTAQVMEIVRMADTDPSAANGIAQILDLLDQMIEQQRAKVLLAARRVLPHLTADDLMNPQDFRELDCIPEFHYEDGILSGYIAAQMAIRASAKRSI